MENCVFCRIVKREIPAAKVWEDEDFLAFLSIVPINPGHTLIIPKKHVDYIFDLENELLGKILIVSKPLALALKKAFKPKMGKVGIMVAGGEIAHAHVHLIPMDHEGDLSFERARHDVPFEEILKNALAIKAALGY